MKGTVKWYDDTKNFGFILSDDDEDVFVHRSGLKDPTKGLEPDQTVEFEMGEGKKGPMAVDVVVID